MSVVSISIVLCLALISSCTESKRHKALSFLFDGVPPLSGDAAELSGPDDGSGRRRPEPTWFVHDPLVHFDPSWERSCPRCHGEKMQRSFSNEVHLVAPTPQLCFECHEPPSFQEGWIHGPVAQGECVFCHEPHRSLQKFLLKKALPEVCYQCHDSQAIADIEDHAKPSYTQCTDCHSGHASVAKYLLKVGPSASTIARTESKPTGLAPFDAALGAARADVQQGQGLAELLQTIDLYIERAEFLQARAYLLALRIDLVYTDVEREQIQILEEMLEAAEQSWEESQLEERDKRASEMARLYYQSIKLYHAGDLEAARRGFVEVYNSDVVPETIRRAIKGYIETIDQVLSGALNHRMESMP
jgi:predicted CXXCH cytochrome family protein